MHNARGWIQVDCILAYSPDAWPVGPIIKCIFANLNLIVLFLH